MDLIKIGKYIAGKRKEIGITLSENLNVAGIQAEKCNNCRIVLIKY